MTTTTTKPAHVLTQEQNHELWELFCSYGNLRWEAESALWVGRNMEESQRLRHEADEVQERYADLLWSLTERPAAVRSMGTTKEQPYLLDTPTPETYPCTQCEAPATMVEAVPFNRNGMESSIAFYGCCDTHPSKLAG